VSTSQGNKVRNPSTSSSKCIQGRHSGESPSQAYQHDEQPRQLAHPLFLYVVPESQIYDHGKGEPQSSRNLIVAIRTTPSLSFTLRNDVDPGGGMIKRIGLFRGHVSLLNTPHTDYILEKKLIGFNRFSS
jgi:hypothetical protein